MKSIEIYVAPRDLNPERYEQKAEGKDILEKILRETASLDAEGCSNK